MNTPPASWPKENPFATRAVRPGALPYLFSADDSVQQLVAQLQAHQWRGEIIGPHGAGKSTLLAALIPELENAGRRVIVGRLGEGEQRVPPSILAVRPWTSKTLLIVDGYEQLGRCRQAWLRYACKRANCGLLVTAHHTTGLPLLAQLSPTRESVDRVISALIAHVPGAVSKSEIDEAFARHRGNVREMLFELYDRYEARRRNEEQARNSGRSPL